MKKLFSFITVSKNRRIHLEYQINWINKTFLEKSHLFEHIIVSERSELEGLNHGALDSRKIIFTEFHQPLNKCKHMNLAAEFAEGKFIIPTDVDLLPLFTPNFLIENQSIFYTSLFTGYRLMLGKEGWEKLYRNSTLAKTIDFEFDQIEIAPEDSNTALLKSLASNEKFGITPIIPRRIFNKIGGYNEKFIGWGAEDQDIINRASSECGPIVKSPEYLWLHCFHQNNNKNWNSIEYTKKNREFYRTLYKSNLKHLKLSKINSNKYQLKT